MEYVKAITTRSGVQLPEIHIKRPATVIEKALAMGEEQVDELDKATKENQVESSDNPQVKATTPVKAYVPLIPFPQRLQKQKLDKQFQIFLDVFKKLHIIRPFAEALAQMPSYAKFMKDILSNKKKLEDNETVMLTEECSIIPQHKLPPKLKDPWSFTIPCNIGNLYIDKALCDLGASINLMHLSLFRKLGLEEAKPTTISLQLADRSIKHPRANFIILDMEEDRDVPLIFGRPFFTTRRALIDIDVIKDAVSETFKLDHPQDPLEACLMHSQDLSPEKEEAKECTRYLAAIPPFFKQPRLELSERPITPLPYIQQALAFELKQLPTHLRYAYLGEKNSLPVIISNNLIESGGSIAEVASRA
ncbi:uncharacterized protein LOC111370160 [Olea europaea var. sylvestris]|uniref:uncharacterized protein LOC111370160 n=1 Tax=Olea europaea var. sylvestris TaxID=158386 RepID=UPI000C1D044B|nr:uncharacterized protein LOC111370160 [Olea europaea var. sylvestris]